MEIKVSKSDLQRAVAITRKALSKIIIQQERGHLLFSVSGGKMRVTGTNNDLKAMCVIPAQCPADARASFTCDPKIISGVLSKMDIADAVLDYQEGEQTVRVFTSEGSSSFAKLQSFPASMMLTFEPSPERSPVPVPRALLSSALKYAEGYLSPPKDDSRNFDIVSISKGIVYSANGTNMMGFMVSNAFKPLEDVRLRKAVVPILYSVLNSIDDESISLIRTANDVGIETASGVYFSALKPAMEPPNAKTELIKSEGPHTIVDRALLLKHIERLVASDTGTDGAVWIQMTLGGAGDSAHIDIALTSSKSVERVPCARADDPSGEDVEHIIEYRILKSVLGSFDHGEKIRLHINDKGGKAVKAYDKGGEGAEGFVQIGIGGYAKRISD